MFDLHNLKLSFIHYPLSFLYLILKLTGAWAVLPRIFVKFDVCARHGAKQQCRFQEFWSMRK